MRKLLGFVLVGSLFAIGCGGDTGKSTGGTGPKTMKDAMNTDEAKKKNEGMAKGMKDMADAKAKDEAKGGAAKTDVGKDAAKPDAGKKDEKKDEKKKD